MSDIYLPAANNGLCSTSHGGGREESESMPQRWMLEQASAQPAVNANQLTSLSAMIAYASHRSGQSEFRIERNLSDRFHIPNAKCLAARDFDRAIRYLADIIPAQA